MHHSRGVCHPGVTLRQRIAQTKFNRADVSKFTDISSDLVYKICQLKQNISVPVAFKLGKFFGNGAEYWLKEQMNYDIVKAEQEINLSEIPAFQNAKKRAD